MQFARHHAVENEGVGLRSFGRFRRSQLGAKDFVPKATRNAETVLVVCVVVLEVVFLERSVPRWQATSTVITCRRLQGKLRTYFL